MWNAATDSERMSHHLHVPFYIPLLEVGSGTEFTSYILDVYKEMPLIGTSEDWERHREGVRARDQYLREIDENASLIAFGRGSYWGI